MNDQMKKWRNQVLKICTPYFQDIDEIALALTQKILTIYREEKVSDFHFRTTSGYGYDDCGRAKLDQVWAQVFGSEQALVRTTFVSGTHALATALFGILRPGDQLISITGTPYDTMQSVIGSPVKRAGSLIDWGITYQEIPLHKGEVDYMALSSALSPKTKAVLIQRSRGYDMTRKSLTIADLERLCAFVKKHSPQCICFVDNCYGEFVEKQEPTQVGADLIAGSLIKNPGGGLVPTGGYIAGKVELVEQAAYHLTAPGLGSHVGASLINLRLLFQGLFLAPHIVAQAVKGSLFAAELFTQLGFSVYPTREDMRTDIIQAIELRSKEKLIAFCQAIQKNSPVDANAVPIPGDMPGYEDPIIMAAGTFIQGASIELSADSPVRPPFCAYLQGGLTFEHAQIAYLAAAQAIVNK